MSDVNGVVKAGWEEVADTFCANFKKEKTWVPLAASMSTAMLWLICGVVWRTVR